MGPRVLPATRAVNGSSTPAQWNGSGDSSVLKVALFGICVEFLAWDGVRVRRAADFSQRFSTVACVTFKPVFSRDETSAEDVLVINTPRSRHTRLSRRDASDVIA